MAKPKTLPLPEGHVVKDYYIGHTHIKICDDCYRDKTPEEIEATWQRINDKCFELLRRQAARKESEKEAVQ